MIKINYLSERAHEVMSKRFKANKHTSIKAWLIFISMLWRHADDAIHKPECNRFIYSELELVLADIIVLCVAILHRLGVTNIENLIRKRIEDNDKASNTR